MIKSTWIRTRKLVRRTLVFLLAFGALSAIGGAVALLLTNGLGMPLAMLDGSPFSSFVIPALFLLVIVGGTQSLGLTLLLRRDSSALLWSSVAGFGMTIWIMVETVAIQGFSALQAVYFTLGILQLALVIGALWIDSPVEHASRRRLAPSTSQSKQAK
ncbi:MAG: hypothetical protein QOD05_970 [Microbacteriaceae bacterium]|jgi:hypothetical protein|nr:hypothetical protein [Microbacteriaceae bacterium]